MKSIRTRRDKGNEYGQGMGSGIRRKIPCVLFSLICCSISGTSTAQHGPSPACIVGSEPFVLAVPACAVQEHAGRLQVHHDHLVDFDFNQHGLAAVYLTGTGWAYIDRRGQVIVRDVAIMDNLANEFHHGLVRVTRGGKWGLANARGKLVVPLQYDGMLDYQPQTGWLACEGCRVVRDGEYHLFEGGKWLLLNAQGKVTGLTRPNSH